MNEYFNLKQIIVMVVDQSISVIIQIHLIFFRSPLPFSPPSFNSLHPSTRFRISFLYFKLNISEYKENILKEIFFKDF